MPHRSIPTVSRTSIGRRPADTQCIAVSGAQQSTVNLIVLSGGEVSDFYTSHDMEAAPEAQLSPLSWTVSSKQGPKCGRSIGLGTKGAIRLLCPS